MVGLVNLLFVPKAYYFIKKYSIGISPSREPKPIEKVIEETRALRSVFSAIFFVAINRRLFIVPWDNIFVVTIFFPFALIWNWMLKRLDR